MLVLAGAALVAACSKSSDGAGSPARDWRCFESSDCQCRVVRPGTGFNGSDEVDDCLDTSCCLLTQTSSDDSAALCECLGSVGDCNAEAKSRRNTSVVTQCPPPGEGKQAKCAADGENCRPDYLRENELSGCCDGSVCKTNAAGVPVCQSATENELTYANLCKKAQREVTKNETFELVTKTVKTSGGEITLPEVDHAFLAVGPDGCVTSLDITLGFNSSGCNLGFDVGLRDGALTLYNVHGSIRQCPGATENAGNLADSIMQVGGQIAFDTLSCPQSSGSYCVAGTFEFQLDGQIGDVLFDNQRIVVTGGVCGGQMIGQCPTVP